MYVLLAAFLQAGAENRTMTVRSSDRIQSIDASFSYEIHVTHGNSRTVTVEYDPVYEEYMKVECSFGKLYLRMEKLPAKLRLSERMTLKVYMEMSKIKDIDMSGASSVTFDGAYDAEDLDIDLSGAARIGFLEVSGESLSLNSSGAANFELRGAFSEDIDMDLSGASNGYVSLKAPELEVDMSGASKLYVFGSYDSTDLHCSGAGNIEIEGDGDTLNLKCSGACTCEASAFDVRNANVELSGASKAMVNAAIRVVADVSKTSKLTYYGDPEVRNVNEWANIRQERKPQVGMAL